MSPAGAAAMIILGERGSTEVPQHLFYEDLFRVRAKNGCKNLILKTGTSAAS